MPIINFIGTPEDLAVEPGLFNTGNVIQISTLPKIEHIQKFVEGISCRKCKSRAVILLGYERSGKVSAFIGRCIRCLKPNVAFFSEDKLASADIVIALGSVKGNEYREQLQELVCSVCQSKLEMRYLRDTRDFDIQRVLPMQAVCPNCPDRLMNLIFWDSPEYYFTKALVLSDEVVPHSPRGGLVFLVAALETFLQKAFLFQSTSNKFLVERRRVSFQYLPDARDFYNEFMNIDLKSLVGDSQWNILANAMRDRHGIIHNAGFDKRFEPITIVPGDLPILHSTIVDFVESLSKTLEAEGLL